MIMHQILPAAMAYSKTLCESILAKKQLGITCSAESQLVQKLSSTIDRCYDRCEQLRNALKHIPQDHVTASTYCHDIIVAKMALVREDADVLEQLTDKNYWPYPTYSDLLYY